GQAVRGRGRRRLGSTPGGEGAHHANCRRGAVASRPGPATGDGGRDRPSGPVDLRPVTRNQGGFPITRASDVHEALKDCLRELHLPAIRRDYESAAQRARQESSSYESYLLELAEQECESRRLSRVARRLRDSRLFLEKTL